MNSSRSLAFASLLVFSVSTTARPHKQRPSPRPEPEVPADACGQPVKAIQPNYPFDALRKAQAGWVLVEFSIDASGKVTDTKVLDASPRHVFDENAMLAMRNGAFSPQGKEVIGCRKLVAFKIGRWD